MKICFVASEANPLCKTGGLADVVYSLAKELVKLGNEVTVVLPFYKCIKDAGLIRVSRRIGFDVTMSWRKQYADVFEGTIDGITYLLVGNDYYFDRHALYGFGDDGERFAFFSLAAMELIPLLDYHPDVVHVHDWQTAIIPVLGKCKNYEGRFGFPKYILTIHNEDFKGYLDRYFLNDFFGLSDDLFDSGLVRFDGMVSTLKAGIVFSDAVTTVSPTHRDELLSYDSPARFGEVFRLHNVLFYGILNGVDLGEFSPAHDPLIAANYTSRDSAKGKALCRERLLSYANLQDNGKPIFGIVSRLTNQKGMDLVLATADAYLREGCSLIVLGSGERGLEDAFEDLGRRYPERVSLYRGYSNQYAHHIYSGADFFLMPSLFEPCGLSQMIAQEYGTLPIVRNVGGLVDSVNGYLPGKEKEATGFSFDNYDADEFLLAIARAVDVYYDKALLRQLIRNAMALDHSWKNSAIAYLKIYQQ